MYLLCLRNRPPSPVEPITGGIVTGPTFSATVFGGLAYPSAAKNGSVEGAEIYIYGNTVNEVPVPYLAIISGIRNLKGQVARLVMESPFGARAVILVWCDVM